MTDTLPAWAARVVRLQYSPRWIVPLCDSRGRAIAVVAVADGPSALRVDGSAFVGSFMSQGEYELFRTDPSSADELPLSPEQAVVFAESATGRRVVGTPRAFRLHPGSLGNHIPPLCARWRLQLDTPIRARGEHGEYETTEVYVRRHQYCWGDLLLQVADREQPETGVITYPRELHQPVSLGPRPGALQGEDTVVVRYVAPVQFDTVTIIR